MVVATQAPTTTVAVYNPRGGVGKTTLAVNLAWSASALSQRRILLWDLDGQAAASWLLGDGGTAGTSAQGTFTRDTDPRALIVRTAYERLDLLPADMSLRGFDVLFHELARKKRLARRALDLARDYDRILIDCPPGLTATTNQVLRAADIVVVPVIPAPLARRALDTVAAHLGRRKRPRVTLAPVFSMVDRRRSLHRAVLAEHPQWAVVPIASVVEQMTDRRAPFGTFAPRASAPVQAVEELWRRVERELARQNAPPTSAVIDRAPPNLNMARSPGQPLSIMPMTSAEIGM